MSSPAYLVVSNTIVLKIDVSDIDTCINLNATDIYYLNDYDFYDWWKTIYCYIQNLNGDIIVNIQYLLSYEQIRIAKERFRELIEDLRYLQFLSTITVIGLPFFYWTFFLTSEWKKYFNLLNLAKRRFKIGHSSDARRLHYLT